MNKKKTNKRNTFGSTVWNDFKKGGFRQPLSQDLKDLYDFYIDKESRKKMDRMNPIRRWIFVSNRILKNMILKLTPGRRLLLFIGLIIIFWTGTVRPEGTQGDPRFPIFGILLLLVVLMLELKDKLLAKDELETGRRIQMALMPEESPHVEGWDVFLYTQPANDVGGDLVDYQDLGDGKYGFALGDVAGKGLGAALVMAKLQSSLRALAPLKKGVCWLADQVNAIFVRDCVPGRFASLVYLELSIKTGEIELINGGHLPPLVKREYNTDEMQKGQVAIGLTKNVDFKSDVITLEKGDFFVVFSDGVTEAQNKFQSFFGESQLKSLIQNSKSHTSHEMGQEILHAVTQFQEGARPHDDLSLIILKRETSW